MLRSSKTPIVLASIALLLAGGAVLVVLTERSGIDWGDVPTWLASVATSSALGLSAITLYRDQQDRRRRDIFEQSAQAKSIILGSLQNLSGGTTAGEDSWRHVKVSATNDSPDAIRDVQLELVTSPSTALSKLRHIDLTTQMSALPPTETITLDRQVPLAADAFKSRDYEITAVLTFTDSSGLRWQLDSKYELKRL